MRRAASFEEKMLRDLLKRKRAYEAYFRGVEKAGAEGGDAGQGPKAPDNSAHSAYVSIIKALVELAKKVPTQRRSPEEMKRTAKEILKREYGTDR
jgi:hypothetical protein